MTTVFMLTSQSKDQQMMSFILKSSGHLLVIDGGNSCDADYLCAYIKKLGGIVDGWFITHPHKDHCNAFSSLMERRADEIKVKTVYYNFPCQEFLKNFDEGRNSPEVAARFEAQISAQNLPSVTVRRGDVYEFGEMKLTVLREPDENIKVNGANNASVVYRVDANGTSMMFLGDLGKEGGEQLLATTPPELLSAELVQVAHHGQNGVGRDVYDAIDADYCFWCTPEWLWDNNIGLGYDTHCWKTIVTRGWMSDIGVKWHYISKDGTQEVPFDDLDPVAHKRKPQN